MRSGAGYEKSKKGMPMAKKGGAGQIFSDLAYVDRQAP